MQKLLILGAGGYGRTVAEAAAGQFETAFLDDASPLALAPCARYAELHLGAILDHDCTLGACAHLAPGAVVKAGNCVPPQAKIDSGCVLGRAAMPWKGNGVHV